MIKCSVCNTDNNFESHILQKYKGFMKQANFAMHSYNEVKNPSKF